MTEKRKKLIISCISGVLILVLLCGTIFLIGSKPSKSNGGSSLEAYSSSEKEKWQFSTIDLTGKLTKEEKGQIKDECQSLLDSYNSVMFNLTPEEIIQSHCFHCVSVLMSRGLTGKKTQSSTAYLEIWESSHLIQNSNRSVLL